jgi:hypothetical protein
MGGGDEFYVCYAYAAYYAEMYYLNDNQVSDTAYWLATDILDCIPKGQGN